MKLTFTFVLILGTIIATAQNSAPSGCTTESLLLTPGSWKETSSSSRGILATDLVKQKKTVAALHTMIKSRYSPMGVLAGMNGGYNSPYPNMPVNSYMYSIIPLDFYCEGNSVKTARETSTYFQIGVNFFSAEIFDTAQGSRAEMEGFNVLSQMPREKDGFYYFDEKDQGLGLGIKGKSRMWLITYEGKLPWAYVTKKEFLEKRKRNLALVMESEASHARDALKNNEIAKTFAEKEYKNDAAKLEKYMRMDYEPIKERYTKQLNDLAKKFNPASEKIDAALKRPASELNESAIVKIDPKDYLSYLFTTETDPMGMILIKPNPGYFNKKLPRSVPQFISIYIAGDPKDPIAANAMTGLVKAIDFTVLKNMLGK